MFESIIAGATVVVSIGLLIFVHELGHFLVAKKVGIRVETFSLGFGPKVFGFVRGGTLYKLSAIPLGGYVKMAGELPTDDAKGEPDEFSSKTVGQRAWVVSAGVIMNVLFALIVFPLAFICGVPYSAPIVGWTRPAGPAWDGDIRPGDEIISVNGSDILGFEDIAMELAFAKADQETLVRLKRNGEIIERMVVPKYDKGTGFNQIGVLGGIEPLRLKDDAYAKKIGVKPGDMIHAINGKPTFRMVDIGDPTGHYSEFYVTTDAPLVLDVERAGQKNREKVVAPPEVGEIDGLPKWFIGIEFNGNMVAEIASSQKSQGPIAELGLMKGDVIVGVGGQAVLTSKEIHRALSEAATGPGFTLKVMRKTGDAPAVEKVLGPIDLSLEDGETIRSAIVLRASGSLFRVQPDSAAAKAGLVTGDKIVGVAGKAIEDKPEAGIDAVIKAIGESEGRAVTLNVLRDGQSVSVDVTPAKRLYNRALLSIDALRPTRTIAHAPFPKSVLRGFKECGYQFEKILAFFRSVFTGRVAAKNVGGIILIAKVSYDFAQEGLGKVLFFMGVLSLNLAFLNILPIPVLDGGHLLFLIIEKIKGSRVSEKFMNICYWIGFLLIIALMLFVTVNDVLRFTK